MRDYYADLCIERTADADAIRAAYLKLAWQFYPDRNPGDETAAARFFEINEANQILSNDEKRARYDRGELAEQAVVSALIIDVFLTVEDFFNGAGLSVQYRDIGGRTRRAHYRVVPGHRPGSIVTTSCDNLSVRLNLDVDEKFTIDGDDIKTTITINDLEAKYGTTFDLDCSWGAPSIIVDAGTIDGSTDTYDALGLPIDDQYAGDLRITWEVEEAPTFSISITATELVEGFDRTFVVYEDGEERLLSVSVDPGWRPGDELELEGEYCYIKLEVELSASWTIDGDDIYVAVFLDRDQADDDFTVDVPLPQGEESIIIGAGTANGEEIVYPGLGLPGGVESSQGDLYVTVVYQEPVFRFTSRKRPAPVVEGQPRSAFVTALRSFVRKLVG